MHVLCEISTTGRYETTLPLTLMAIALQTKTPNDIIIYEDGDAIDLRTIPVYDAIFKLFQQKNINFSGIYIKPGRGQHLNHEDAQSKATDLVWRLDDDVIPEANCLKILYNNFTNDRYKKIGAVGGLVLTHPAPSLPDNLEVKNYNRIDSVFSSMNIQMYKWPEHKRKLAVVDHLHCTFLHRPNIARYNKELSRIAHTEETQFTYEIKRAGYKVLVDPNAVNWHLKFNSGGIRSGSKELFEHDFTIYTNKLIEWGVTQGKIVNQKIVYLNCGVGDHLCFKMVLPELRKKYDKITIISSRPQILWDQQDNQVSITLLNETNKPGNLEEYSPYTIGPRYNCHILDCFRKLYL